MNPLFQKGISLVNLLISLFLSSIFLVSAMHWVGFIQKVYHNQVIHQKNQELARNTFRYLGQAILGAGYRGCRSTDPYFPLYKNFSDTFPGVKYIHFDKSLLGFFASPGACYGNMPKSACSRLKENTDVLILYNVPKKVSHLKKTLEKADDPILTLEYPEIRKNSLVLISDCFQGDLFIATEVEGKKIHHDWKLNTNKMSTLSKKYSRNGAAEVVELQTLSFYLGTPERYQKINKNPNQKNQEIQKSHYALFQDDFLHAALEIVPDVSDFKLLYGLLDIKTGQLYYVEASKISDWNEVQTVRIKVISEQGAIWEHEFALRNQLRNRLDSLNRPFISDDTIPSDSPSHG